MDAVTLGMAKSDAKRRYARGSVAVAPGYDLGASGEYPRVVKPLSGPLFSKVDQSAESMYWPWLVDMSQDGASTGWAVFYSTDHAATHANSGLFAASGPTPFDMTTFHGRVYRDDTNGGGQCETPSIIWDEAANLWRIYYQRAGVTGTKSNQVTEMATAPAGALLTGASWTRVGVVLDAPTFNSPIPGATVHQGYFHPFRYAGGWFGYNLCGGTFGGMQGQVSANGIDWQATGRLPRQGPSVAHIPGFDPLSWLLKWIWSSVIDWRGQPWLIGVVTGEAAGTETAPPCKIAVAPLSPDFRRPLAPLRDVTPPAQGWEVNVIDSVGNAISYNGRILLPYRSNGNQGAFSLLEVI